MQSVALTELNSNDEEFVIVEAPRALIESSMFGGSSRTLSSLADDDDASYDYCDDVYSMPSALPSRWDDTYRATTRGISEEFNLPPNLTDTDVEDAVEYLQTDKFLSLKISDDRLNQPSQRSYCLSIGGAASAASTVSDIDADRLSDSSLPSSVSNSTKEAASITTEGESEPRLPAPSSAATRSSASSISFTRLSNKKRRKQVQLAKKAAAAAAAAAALAQLTSNNGVPVPTATSTKTILHNKKVKKTTSGRSKPKKLRSYP